MAVTNGPQIRLRADIGAEVGLGSSSDVNMNNASIRALIGKGSGVQTAMSEYYGASSATVAIALAGFTNSGSGTSSSPWVGNSTNAGIPYSQANIYFEVSGGSVTFNVYATVSSQYLGDYGAVFNGYTALWESSGSDSYSNSSVTVADGSFLRIAYVKNGSIDVGQDRVTYSIYRA